MTLRTALIAALSLLAVGCSSESEPTGDGSLDFGEMGSPSDPDGAGSFRFGAASAATQIEDQNPNTDWYVFTAPETQGGEWALVGDASM
jgi:beta-glucosidase